LQHAFESLTGLIPGLLKREVGLDFRALDYACDVAQCSEFDSEASLKADDQDASYLEAKAIIGDIRVARHPVD
jgi:hypothetical protein